MMELLYRGFDGLDVSFQGQINSKFADALDAAKTQAQKFRQAEPLEWNGVHMTVSDGGARGGYAFQASTGNFGATWFFKKPNIHDPWGVRVSCSSYLLALNGLGGARAAIYSVLDALEVALPANAESIGRVDYALDYLAPALTLSPNCFVMHSNSRRSEHHELHHLGVAGHSGRVTSVTVGKMPGRQIIVYDKRAEIIANNKMGWWEIWNANRTKEGNPTLIRDCPSTSPVWRVELRAGKHHLKERWRITSWADLDNRFGDMTAATLSAIRYTDPTDDSNRSRWPDSPLWRAVRVEIEQDLFEMRSWADPNLVKAVQRSEHDKLLARQMTGLLTSRAAISGLNIGDLPAFAETVGQQMAAAIRAEESRFAKKLTTSSMRYHVSG